MVTVLFYEKPGCASNARQKQILRQAGATLDVRNLLTEAWTAPRLRTYFGTRPVAEWLNPSAPAIKSGRIDPFAIDPARLWANAPLTNADNLNLVAEMLGVPVESLLR